MPQSPDDQAPIAIDPHADDYCVVCGDGPDAGRTMHPAVSIENGCVCEECVND